MPPAYFCATVIALTLILVSSALLLFQWAQRGNRQLLEILATTTNLAASKELTTFQSLQTSTTHQSPNESEPLPVMNDQAMAHILADRFEKQGIDPAFAYANDDNPIDEFGLH